MKKPSYKMSTKAFYYSQLGNPFENSGMLYLPFLEKAKTKIAKAITAVQKAIIRISTVFCCGDTAK